VKRITNINGCAIGLTGIDYEDKNCAVRLGDGKGTWESNPLVFAYEYKRID